MWQLPAIAVAALVAGAVLVAGRDDTAETPPPPGGGTAARAAACALAVLALVTVAVPLAGALTVRQSQAAAAGGRLAAALQDARTAQRLQPYAATPRLQQALVLESAGDYAAAAALARAATGDEPTNWRTWLVLARLDARSGRDDAAVAAFARARRLHPMSTLFTAR